MDFDVRTLPPLLTVKEAAEVLRVHEHTIRRLIRQGKIPGTKLGRDFRVPKYEFLKTLHNPQPHYQPVSA